MKTYRVHLTVMTCGDVIVEALDREEAEQQAMLSPAIDWDSDPAVKVTNIVELDARAARRERRSPRTERPDGGFSYARDGSHPFVAKPENRELRTKQASRSSFTRHYEF